jgi:hypothetical protein
MGHLPVLGAFDKGQMRRGLMRWCWWFTTASALGSRPLTSDSGWS